MSNMRGERKGRGEKGREKNIKKKNDRERGKRGEYKVRGRKKVEKKGRKV